MMRKYILEVRNTRCERQNNIFETWVLSLKVSQETANSTSRSYAYCAVHILYVFRTKTIDVMHYLYNISNGRYVLYYTVIASVSFPRINE